MVHGLVTLVWCIACIALGLPWPVLFWPPAFYVGREEAQAEARWVSAHGGKRENCSVFCGFFPGAWDLKSLLDWVLPFTASLTAVLLQRLLHI